MGTNFGPQCLKHQLCNVLWVTLEKISKEWVSRNWKKDKNVEERVLAPGMVWEPQAVLQTTSDVDILDTPSVDG